MKYKQGDKVKIRADLNLNDEYGGLIPALSMCRERGNVATIKNSEERDGLQLYRIEGGMCNFLWTEEMFEGLAEEKITNDPVSHPSHYTDGRIEVIDFIQDKHLDFARGNIIKYVARAGKKGGKEKELEDLKKARQYCDFAIREMEAGK